MPYQPEELEAIETSVQTQISNQAPTITAWFEQTSNDALSDVFSEGLYEREQEILYVWLASSLQFAAKEITEDDLRSIGLNPAAVDLQRINALQSDADLEAAAADRGVSRLPGSYARGEILVTFASAGASADAGFEVVAPAFDGGEDLRYVTTEIAQADENTTVATVPIRAVERGTRYNTGGERIETVPNQQPANVQDVTNPDPITGGEQPESNDELRERARGASLEDANLKQRIIAALNTAQGGGVTERDIKIDEHTDGLPTRPETQGAAYGEIVIDYNGPTDTLVDSDGDAVGSLQELVDAEKAYGMGIFYEPPEVHTLDVTAEVAPDESGQVNATAADISEIQIEEAILQHIDARALGGDFYSAHLETAITDADENVAYAPTLTMTVTAPDSTTTTVGRASRYSISDKEKIQPGDITVTAIENPSTGA